MNDLLADLPERFVEYLDDNGWRYSAEVAVDLLASVLGSQFVVFAGPSGTGKSTAAHSIANFLSPADRTVRIDVEPGWQSLSDLLGYYSGIGGTYLPGPYLDRITDLAATGNTPFLIFEEANLSPIEAYLTAIMQDLSQLHAPSLVLPLHDLAEGEARDSAGKEIPRRLELGPFPRLLTTINVDPEAPAPANKVVGRAAVVLLEPPDGQASTESVDALYAGSSSPSGGIPQLVGDPRDALSWYRSNGSLRTLTAPLDQATGRLAQATGRNTVSKRDEARALLYMAYYVTLAQQPPLSRTQDEAALEAADNALLHYALPSLPASSFNSAVNGLLDDANHDPSALLKIRLERLQKHLSDESFVPLDFWACLT